MLVTVPDAVIGVGSGSAVGWAFWRKLVLAHGSFCIMGSGAVRDVASGNDPSANPTVRAPGCSSWPDVAFWVSCVIGMEFVILKIWVSSCS